MTGSLAQGTTFSTASEQRAARMAAAAQAAQRSIAELLSQEALAQKEAAPGDQAYSIRPPRGGVIDEPDSPGAITGTALADASGTDRAAAAAAAAAAVALNPRRAGSAHARAQSDSPVQSTASLELAWRVVFAAEQRKAALIENARPLAFRARRSLAREKSPVKSEIHDRPPAAHGTRFVQQVQVSELSPGAQLVTHRLQAVPRGSGQAEREPIEREAPSVAPGMLGVPSTEAVGSRGGASIVCPSPWALATGSGAEAERAVNGLRSISHGGSIISSSSSSRRRGQTSTTAPGSGEIAVSGQSITRQLATRERPAPIQPIPTVWAEGGSHPSQAWPSDKSSLPPCTVALETRRAQDTQQSATSEARVLLAGQGGQAGASSGSATEVGASERAREASPSTPHETSDAVPEHEVNHIVDTPAAPLSPASAKCRGVTCCIPEPASSSAWVSSEQLPEEPRRSVEFLALETREDLVCTDVAAAPVSSAAAPSRATCSTSLVSTGGGNASTTTIVTAPARTRRTTVANAYRASAVQTKDLGTSSKAHADESPCSPGVSPGVVRSSASSMRRSKSMPATRKSTDDVSGKAGNKGVRSAFNRHRGLHKSANSDAASSSMPKSTAAAAAGAGSVAAKKRAKGSSKKLMLPFVYAEDDPRVFHVESADGRIVPEYLPPC